MEKRGELTSTQIVTIILALVGFALVGLALYSIFEDDSLTNRDICRLSILSRATVPALGQQLVPLNCQTEKICITVDGKNNDCKQFAGEKNVRKVEVKVDGGLNDARAIETIQREVANAMYDCWLMTGQGKLDIFPPGNSDGSTWSFVEQITAEMDLNSVSVKPSCIVCSRLAFSDALYESDKQFNFLKDIDYNNFMSTQVVPGTTRTYTSVFTGESGTGYASIAQEESLGEKPKGFNEPKGSSHFAVVFAQIKVSGEEPKDQFWNTLKAGGIVGGVAAVSSPGSILSVPLTIIKILTVGAISTNLAFNAESTTSENQAISAATCGNFESTIEGQKGCSLVKLMDWNVNEVNSLCSGGIEGNL